MSINMYSGESTSVMLRCHISIISELINTFGCNFSSATDGEWFSMTIRAADNEGLYRLVMQYGDKIEVISPKQIRDTIKNNLAAALALYDRLRFQRDARKQ